MSTPTEERDDLLIRNSGRAFYESWCTIRHSSETGSNPSFSSTWKEKKYLQAYLDQRRHFSPPLWFHVMKCLERKSRYSTTTTFCCKARQEIRKVLFLNYKLHEARLSIAIVRAAHLCILESRIFTSGMSQHRQWEDRAGLSPFYHMADNKRISVLNKSSHAETSVKIKKLYCAAHMKKEIWNRMGAQYAPRFTLVYR